MKHITIDVKDVTRVEGHGNIAVNVEDGELTKIELQIVESPRYFEAFLRGRKYYEAPHITCRICGICSVGHTSASVQAIENACGINISEQSLLLRKLLLMGEELQSHILHVYFLAVPDYVGVGSVIPLAQTHRDVVERALRLKKLSNDICGAVGGRHIHPITVAVGGMTHVPKPDELIALKRRLEDSRADLTETVKLYKTFDIPELHRKTEYFALKVIGNGEYAFYNGDMVSTLDPKPTKVEDYRKRIQETVVEHSSAKHCSSPNSPTYMVGALARFMNNHEQLHPAARQVAEELSLRPDCDNPMHNNTAQLVEIVHCVETSIELIDELLTRGLKLEPLVEPTGFSKGVGSTEVPRGLLVHEYELDDRGVIVNSNLVIPTGQNLANIEADMRAWMPQLLESSLGKEEITLRLEMLVRAYDPCISCSVHFLNIEWN